MFGMVQFVHYLKTNDTGALINFFELYGPNDSYTNWYKESNLMTALTKLSLIRVVLESDNLWDMYKGWYPSADCSPSDFLTRQLSGTCNDRSLPAMGSVGTRFGRNIMPLLLKNRNDSDLLVPNPRLVSRKFLAKPVGKEGKIYEHLNMLVTAWIQFQTHDWFIHDNSLSNEDAFAVPLEADDPLAVNGLNYMYIQRTQNDQTRKPSESNFPNSHLNKATHWWDLDQVYGNEKSISDSLRTFIGGMMKLDSNNAIPLGDNGLPKTAVTNNWWIGLEILHNLFVNEHNSIAIMLSSAHPDWTDQKLYDTARMINAALVAKIHTLEWTPAIISNPALEVAMNANWNGLAKYLIGGSGTLADSTLPALMDKVVFGIVGHAKNLHKNPLNGQDVPFSITEEFVSVYRMHALLPDAMKIYNRTSGTSQVVDMTDLMSSKSNRILTSRGLADLFLSFGMNNPVQLTLNNYAEFLQNLKVRGNSIDPTAVNMIDLGTVDILRDRERAVPLYNAFRQQLKLQMLKNIDELTDDEETKNKLKEVYGEYDTINKIDLLVGILAESRRPYCFGFSETIFNVFALMATRRLEADSFYTINYTPEVYSEEGLNWIKSNTMKDVLLRHVPDLKNTGLDSIENAFFTWPQKFDRYQST
jgi:hypothetical protein